VVAWSPDGRTLAAGLDNGVALIDPSTAKQTATLVAPEAVRALAWSPDGSQIAVNGGEKAIALLDRATGKSRAFGTDGVYILAWAGKRLASWSPDSGVRLFNPITGALEQTWDTNPASPLGGATGMIYQMSVEGDRVAIGTVDGAVLLFRLGEAKPLARATGHVGRVPAVQFAGKWLVSAGADSTLRLWDAATLKPVSAASPLEQPVADVAIMGKKLHMQFADDSVCVYDRASGTWNETSSPSERRLAARESLFSLHLGKQELRRDEKVLATGIRAMTVSADGSTLLTRDDTGSLSVRDVQGKVLRTLVNVEKNQQLLLSPRGTRILRNARRHFSSC
jgi:WD40 repeat protein